MNELTVTAPAEPTFIVYIAGSCRPNPGPGGWAITISHPDGKVIERSGHEPDATNNRMTMEGVIQALQRTPETATVLICTDCQTTIDGATDWAPNKWMKNGWKAANNKPVKNRNRWELIMDLISSREVTFQHVKSNPRNPKRERASVLAKEASSRGPYSHV